MSWGSWATLAAVPALRDDPRLPAAWWLGRLEARIPLAVKLAVPVVITTGVLVAFLAVIVTDSIQAQIEGSYERQATVVADGVAAVFAEHPNDIAVVDDYLARVVASNPDLLTVRIHSLDRDATVTASSNSAEVGMTGLPDSAELDAIWSGQVLEDEFDGPVLTTVVPLRAGDLLYGAVVIQSKKAPQLAAIWNATVVIGAAASVGITVESAFVLFTLYFGILRRTRRIQRAVEAVAAGDPTVRLPEGAKGPAADEIVNLARNVDHMIVALDERRRGDLLIRTVMQKALEGTPTEALIAESLSATKQMLGLEACLFVTIDDQGRPARWVDGTAAERTAMELPVWVFALAAAAAGAKKTVLTNRLGRLSRFAGAPGAITDAEAAIVPLPRSSGGSHAIVAIAAEGESMGDGGVPVLDAVAAVIAESLHMQAAENARAESAVKSRVMSAVSHEMRNPLNSILGFTGLVLGDGITGLTDKQRRQLGYVQNSARNMLELVNNYLDLSRVRAGNLTLQYESVNLGQLLGDAVTSVEARAAAKTIAIRTSADSSATARIDPIRVRQVLGNLLSNAIAFTPDNGNIYLRARVDRDVYRFVVSDTGVGIKKEQRELLFKEFSKIDAGAMAAAKGTGLGLVLTESLVKAMRGNIRVYSRRGRGTTVAVTLPRTDAVARSSAA